MTEALVHFNLSEAAICVLCEAVSVGFAACPCCTSNKLVPLAPMKREIVRWAEGVMEARQ